MFVHLIREHHETSHFRNDNYFPPHYARPHDPTILVNIFANCRLLTAGEAPAVNDARDVANFWRGSKESSETRSWKPRRSSDRWRQADVTRWHGPWSRVRCAYLFRTGFTLVFVSSDFQSSRGAARSLVDKRPIGGDDDGDDDDDDLTRR